MIKFQAVRIVAWASRAIQVRYVQPCLIDDPAAIALSSSRPNQVDSRAGWSRSTCLADTRHDEVKADEDAYPALLPRVPIRKRARLDCDGPGPGPRPDRRPDSRGLEAGDRDSRPGERGSSDHDLHEPGERRLFGIRRIRHELSRVSEVRRRRIAGPGLVRRPSGPRQARAPRSSPPRTRS